MVSGGLPKATLRERLEARSESPRRATRRNDRGHEQAIECSRSRDTGGASRASGEGDPEGAFPGRAALSSTSFFSNSPALRAATDEQVRRFRTVVEGALLNKLGKVA